MCITHLLQHEVIHDLQTLMELIDKLKQIVRALSKEEESDQWEEILPYSPGSILCIETQDQER